jgi:hypothetical protein
MELDPLHSQMNPVHGLQFFSFKHFNIIIPSMPNSS